MEVHFRGGYVMEAAVSPLSRTPRRYVRMSHGATFSIKSPRERVAQRFAALGLELGRDRQCIVLATPTIERICVKSVTSLSLSADYSFDLAVPCPYVPHVPRTPET